MKFGQSKKFGAKDAPEVVSETVEVEQVIEEKQEPELTTTGHALLRHPEGGWGVATVKFNPVTMEAQVIEVKKAGDSRSEAEHNYRIIVGKHWMEIQ